MRSLNIISAVVGLALSTTSMASVLLTHLNKNHQWDTYKVENARQVNRIITAGEYAWAILDTHTIMFFNGKTWEKSLVTPRNEVSFYLQPGYPTSGNKPTAWLIGANYWNNIQLDYFDGQTWTTIDTGGFSIMNIATSGGNAWLEMRKMNGSTLEQSALGLVNRLDPLHIKKITYDDQDQLPVFGTAADDEHPYLYAYSYKGFSPSVATLHQIDPNGHDNVLIDGMVSHSASQTVDQYKDNLLYSVGDNALAYSMDDSATLNVFNPVPSLYIDNAKKIFGHFYCGFNSDAKNINCFDLWGSMAGLKAIDVPHDDNFFVTETDAGVWYLSTNMSMLGLDLTNVDADTATAKNINMANYLSALDWYQGLTNNRMVACGKNINDQTAVFYYADTGVSINTIPSSGRCSMSSKSISADFFSPDDNVWFGFDADDGKQHIKKLTNKQLIEKFKAAGQHVLNAGSVQHQVKK